MKLKIHAAILTAMIVAPMTSCQTVSDQSPIEFQAAQAALKEAEAADVDNFTPAAMELADQKFKQALRLLEDSSRMRKDGNIAQADATLDQATALADEARQIAEMGLSIRRDATAFDRNLTRYVPLMARAERIGEMEEELAALQIENARLLEDNDALVSQIAEESAVAALERPVAFFSSGSTKVDPRYRAEIQDLAETLKENPELMITLEGHTDPTGSARLNKRLAEQRAKEVSKILQKAGITADRIQVEVVEATPSDRSQVTNLQAERKVVAKFQDTAH